MKQYVARYCWWGIGLILSGCTAQAVSQSLPSPTASVNPPTESVDVAPQRRFQIKLTLSSPNDLKVQEGNQVQEGQIIADRVHDRSRLEFQQQQLQGQIKRLRLQLEQPIPEVAGLPTSSFLSEVAEVERLKIKATDAQRVKEQQQRKLDLLQSMPKSDLPEATIPHEQALLDQKQRLLDQALAEVETAKGKLAKAENDRQFQEYEHSLEMSKRAISLRQQEIQQQGQLAQLEGQLSQVETQLSTLSAVRSPYSGRIQRIKFSGQNDQALSVELVLVVADISSHPGAVQPPPSPTVSPGKINNAPGENVSR
ncbi:hypothetical protein K9N68_06005 [Kovacikia minuta CCNUW1]|uniref:hypothetical protein n=1 Tax=Kovacikia minuta TaxID=2931930 RepID=UPI001CCDB920|nr:hypothetical protein [Kovacikia minuta]UBF27494.1 hypothetical protein K9N68_06005 [Kovacikia minuta CCNUW1]